MTKRYLPTALLLFFSLSALLNACTGTDSEALDEARDELYRQDKEIEFYKQRIDTLEQSIRALSMANNASADNKVEQVKDEMDTRTSELREAIKRYRKIVEKKEKEFRTYRNLALEQKRIREIREEKKRLKEDNDFIAKKINELRRIKEFTEVISGLSDIIEKIPHFNKFDCYYRDRRDLDKGISEREGTSPKLLLIEPEGTYPKNDIGKVFIDLDLNFFKLEGNPDEAMLTLCLYEKDSPAPVFCQDEIFDRESKRVEWKPNAKDFEAKTYYFIVKYGDQTLTEKYNFTIVQ